LTGVQMILTEIQKTQAIKLRARGHSPPVIAGIIGCSPPTIVKLLKANGFTNLPNNFKV